MKFKRRIDKKITLVFEKKTTVKLSDPHISNYIAEANTMKSDKVLFCGLPYKLYYDIQEGYILFSEDTDYFDDKKGAQFNEAITIIMKRYKRDGFMMKPINYSENLSQEEIKEIENKFEKLVVFHNLDK
jgi:hypothetical protein